MAKTTQELLDYWSSEVAECKTKMWVLQDSALAAHSTMKEAAHQYQFLQDASKHATDQLGEASHWVRELVLQLARENGVEM